MHAIEIYPPVDAAVSRSVTRLRELASVLVSRSRTERETQEAEYERGKIAGLRGLPLRGVESSWFLTGHARGCVDARGE